MVYLKLVRIAPPHLDAHYLDSYHIDLGPTRYHGNGSSILETFTLLHHPQYKITTETETSLQATPHLKY